MTLRNRFSLWIEARRARLDARPPKRCNSNSGLFMGYRCDRKRGHAGRHKALISRTVTNGCETERREVSWA